MATKKTETEEKTKKTTAKKPTTTKTTTKKTETKKPATKKTETKTTTKKTTAKKTDAKTTTKKATTKKTETKTTKKPTTKKSVVEPKKTKVVKTSEAGIKVVQKDNEGDLLGLLGAVPSTPTPVEEQVEEKTTPKKPTSKTTTKPTTTKPTTKKTEPKTKKPATTPTRPVHKARTFTKDEKVLYKRLEEAFNYVANLTMVIEERTLDEKLITDLTLGELHVLEVVNKEASIPMTKVANQLKITVGSLTTCVNRLVKKEYLYRERDENDHRIIKVSTTQKAKKALKVHDVFHEQILLGVLDGVTIRDATKVMAQFARTLENYINPKEKNYEKPIDTKKKKNI